MIFEPVKIDCPCGNFVRNVLDSMDFKLNKVTKLMHKLAYHWVVGVSMKP